MGMWKVVCIGVASLVMACSSGGGSPHDAPASDVAIDSIPVDAGHCDVLTQTGCFTGEKCNWIYDQLMPIVVAHIGCEPVGITAVGGACGQRVVGPDPCVRGAECISGECKQICGLDGTTAACDADHSCTQYQNLFVIGTTTLAGVCDPGCDPLTQDLRVGTNRTACGSQDPTNPTRACYGVAGFGCAGMTPTVLSASERLTYTDRVPPSGGFLNACTAGYQAILSVETGSTSVRCNGFCAALETDNTPAHAGNGKGDPNAIAKLPQATQPRVGDGTCDIGKKGSDATSSCRFLWFHLKDSMGQLPPAFASGPYVDTLGVCLATAFYKYDANGDGTPETTYPDCAMLPPRSNATPGPFDDAADWGCQLRSHSMFTGQSPAMPSAIEPADLDGAVPVRHLFQ